MSLSGSAFTWFTTLPANSIIYWTDLEKQFHQFFYSGIEEMKQTDLTNLRQRNDESVATFIQRFRDVKNRCYSVIIKGGSVEKKGNDASKIIGGVLYLSTAGKKG